MTRTDLSLNSSTGSISSRLIDRAVFDARTVCQVCQAFCAYDEPSAIAEAAR